jgi:hypothetical protein
MRTDFLRHLLEIGLISEGQYELWQGSNHDPVASLAQALSNLSPEVALQVSEQVHQSWQGSSPGPKPQQFIDEEVFLLEEIMGRLKRGEISAGQAMRAAEGVGRPQQASRSQSNSFFSKLERDRQRRQERLRAIQEEVEKSTPFSPVLNKNSLRLAAKTREDLLYERLELKLRQRQGR